MFRVYEKSEGGKSELKKKTILRMSSSGRLRLPSELIRERKVNEVNDRFLLFTQDDKIILKRCDSVCKICGTKNDLKFLNGNLYCKSCIKKCGLKTPESSKGVTP